MRGSGQFPFWPAPLSVRLCLQQAPVLCKVSFRSCSCRIIWTDTLAFPPTTDPAMGLVRDNQQFPDLVGARSQNGKASCSPLWWHVLMALRCTMLLHGPKAFLNVWSQHGLRRTPCAIVLADLHGQTPSNRRLSIRRLKSERGS